MCSGTSLRNTIPQLTQRFTQYPQNLPILSSGSLACTVTSCDQAKSLRPTGGNMKRLRFLLCALVALATAPAALHAGANRWTSSGPEGAQVVQIVADPADAAVAYALTFGGGIFKTPNGGERWRAVNDGLPVAPVALVTTLLVVPDSALTLYVAAGGAIFITTDGAEHWSSRGNFTFNVVALAFDTVSRTLYAGTNSGSGVMRSVDGGQTWEAATGSLHNMYVGSLAVAPNGTVYAVGQDFSAPGASQLFRTNDNGQTWTVVSSSPPPDQVVVDRESSTVYVQEGSTLFASKDEGKTWTPLPVAPNLQSVAPAGAGHLYAATGNGVIEYRESSHAWTSVGSAISNPDLHALTISSSTPRRFYIAEDFGVLTSVENQTDWITANSGLPGAYANDVAVVPSDPAVAYAATLPGAFKTEDRGQSWQQTGTKQVEARVVEVSPMARDTAFVSDANVVLKTVDGGATWNQVNPSPATLLALAPSDPAIVYAALVSGLSKSSNGGQTWASIVSDLPLVNYFAFYGFSASSIAVDPSSASTVYLGQPDGLFKTTNSGGHWSQLSTMANVLALAIDTTDSSVVYAAPGGGVLKSIDAGATWKASGLIDKRVDTLAISSTQPSVLYAGTDDGHVYRSDDGGQFWTDLDAGLGGGSVLRLRVDSSGDVLYAATTAGVYEYHAVGDNVQIARLPDDLLRLPRLFDQLSVAPNATGFILPIVGTAAGVGGSFATDVTLFNNGASPQDVFVAWLQEGNTSGSAPSFRLTLPAQSDTTGGAFNLTAERLGISGIGSLVVVAVAGTESSLDANATIDGSAVIWTHPADGRAPFSQSVPAVRYPLFAEHARAEATGFRHDAKSRTNVGIVNLSSEWHQFTIAVTGERASNQFTLAVPPFSLVQTRVPPGDYGTLSLVVFADTSTRWTFYGSSIDNVTGEARTSVGTPSVAH
jgi:photosystem II stability/assembly factor-like uncharacterized protein